MGPEQDMIAEEKGSRLRGAILELDTVVTHITALRTRIAGLSDSPVASTESVEASLDSPAEVLQNGPDAINTRLKRIYEEMEQISAMLF